ncbi:MAG: gamma-glutamyl-gamma-aminobutyrate hydrolase family protein [Chloroflexia bacterium]
MPLVGLNGDFYRTEWGEVVGVFPAYVEAVIQAGGTPLLIPPLTEREALAALLGRLDGLILTGGLDLPPDWYGQEPHPSTKLADPRRLAGDRLLAEMALASPIPILAVCMGCQLLNIALGGDLIQDIPSQVAGALSHAPKETFHPVRIEPGSRLAGIVGREELEVNSSHHQAVGRPGKGLRVVARAPDGVIEAVEGEGKRFLLGVQWHPERLSGREAHLALFRALVGAAKGY